MLSIAQLEMRPLVEDTEYVDSRTWDEYREDVNHSKHISLIYERQHTQITECKQSKYNPQRSVKWGKNGRQKLSHPHQSLFIH